MAALLCCCGGVVVLSSVLLLTDCTCWLQHGVTGPETSGQWSHSGGAAHWPLATQPPAPPLPSGPPCPCQPSVSRVRRWLSPTHLWHWTLDYCCGEQTHQWSQWSTCQNFSIYLPPPEMNHVKPFESCWFSFASIVLCRYIVNGCVDIICEELNLWTAEWEIIRKSDARTALATVTHPVTVAGPHLPSLHLLSWVSWYLGTGSVSCLNNLQYHYQISGTCNCTTRQATIMAYLIY